MRDTRLTQRRGLIATTLLLEEHARDAAEPQLSSYTTAVILCAHAAAECILSEWAQQREPEIGLRMTREGWPLVRALEELLPRIDAALPANIVLMANVRNWLCAPGPEYYRAAHLADWLTREGARRALAVVLSLESQFFPGGEAAIPR